MYLKYHFLKPLFIVPIFIFIWVVKLEAQHFPADPSKITISVKKHSFGRHKIVSNLGFMARPPQFEIDDFPKMIAKKGVYQNNVLAGEGRNALFIGGKIGSHKVFTCGEDWSDNSSYSGFEFFPSGEPWDTIWVVGRDEIVDIPYWKNYKGISDQDFVCRYDDYHIHVPDQTRPLGIEVIQTSHTWGMKSYNIWTYFQFYVIPKQTDIQDMYFAWWNFGGLGVQNPDNPVPSSMDDLVYFDSELNMAFREDLPGWDADGMAGPIGMAIWPPDDVPSKQIKWSFNNTIMVNHNDEQWYDILSSGTIDPPSSDGDAKGVHGFLTFACGPFDVKVGDTLHFRVVNVAGVGKEGVVENLNRLEKFIERGFALPTFPPAPPLRVEAGNHKAILRWDARPGDIDPVTWTDKYRADYDIEPQPFEGFKIYKSFTKNGPWTLLAQFDVADNDYGVNTGLVFEYTDVGLLNNVEYYYAVTAFSKPDRITGNPSLETARELSRVKVIPGTQVPETVGEVFVVPNPYRGDLNYSSYKPPWETPDPRRNIYDEPGKDRWTEYDRHMQFVNIPSPAEIKIYSSAGDLINTLRHDDPSVGIMDWNLTSYVGQTVGSGIYLYTVEDKKSGKIQVGKFVVIK